MATKILLTTYVTAIKYNRFLNHYKALAFKYFSALLETKMCAHIIGSINFISNL
jgi:hypothetical protein